MKIVINIIRLTLVHDSGLSMVIVVSCKFFALVFTHRPNYDAPLTTHT